MITPAIKVIVDDRGAQKYLKDVRGRFDTKRRVFEGPIMNLLTDFFEKQFETEGEHGGYPWEKLKDNTKAIKARLGFGDKGMLRREDTLFDALTQRGGRVPGRKLRITGEKLDFEITVEHGYIQQWGAPKHNLPARHMLPPRGMPDEFLDRLQNVIAGYIITGRFRDDS